LQKTDVQLSSLALLLVAAAATTVVVVMVAMVVVVQIPHFPSIIVTPSGFV
jgi:hypothetical protein